jgi:hypothetical protein
VTKESIIFARVFGGKIIAACVDFSGILLLDLKTGKELQKIETPPITCMDANSHNIVTAHYIFTQDTKKIEILLWEHQKIIKVTKTLP